MRHIFEANVNRFTLVLQVPVAKPLDDLTYRHSSATRQGWSKGIGRCDASMKFCVSSSSAKPARSRVSPPEPVVRLAPAVEDTACDVEACEHV